VAVASERMLHVASLAAVQATGRLVSHVDGRTLVLFADGATVHAVDNRCPHMGFPLHRGTVKDGVLTCHWHHARFDLCSGGTFDPWADDLRRFPTVVRDGEVWVDLTPRADVVEHQRTRVRDGLERNLSLVVAKGVIALLEAGVEPAEPYRIGVEFGVRHRREGWGQGLTMLTCFANLLPRLRPEDGQRALYHGLSAVAVDSAGSAPRFPLRPLPGDAEPAQLKRWFRQFVEVRDADGAERCIVSAARSGAGSRELADMLFAAVTDHRYVSTGHPLDFTNKALEGLDLAGWERAEPVLASLATQYAEAVRMEESNAWRNPVDVVAIVENAFERLPAALARPRVSWAGRDEVVPVLLGEDAQAIADALVDALAAGARAAEVAQAVSYAAALRIARFPTSNEFADWDTALHTFTFANAVEQGLRRAPSPELLRGVFDAAMSVYLDRFLNVPATRLPEPDGTADPQELLAELPLLLDRQQQVNETGALVAAYLAGGGPPDALIAALGAGLVREDRDFHTIQMLEAAVRQYATLGEATVLVAAGRYLAAHAPTPRAEGQTFAIARRLHRNERLYEDEEVG
jgi:nitrite reductase/ring-hydroxylating ferredoxin subunit